MLQNTHKKIKSLADALAAIDDQVTNSDFVSHTLNGLGSE